jgi:hypothetical protein
MGSADCSGGNGSQDGALRLAGVLTDRDHRPLDDEVEWLRDTLVRYERHKDFWYEFLTKLTPVGLLRLNGNLAMRIPNPPPGEQFADPDLAETLGDIQTLLGDGLATATARRGARTQWLVGLTQAGRRRYELAPTWAYVPTPFRLYGYQLLGPLLQHGAYDARFLRIVGGDMVHFELTHGGGRCWLHELGAEVHNLRLDWTAGAAPTEPPGLDPLLGLMSAMDRNPRGAIDLLAGVTDGGIGLHGSCPSSDSAHRPSHH